MNPMSLDATKRVGPYEILSRLGAGGMGEVYRARDSRLHREVALKVLPPSVAADAGRNARFEQEARSVAALNHPNILQLYDLGAEDGVAYMVTELVAGETLGDMLERGPLPIRKLLDIAVQLADGMACAHAARFTHRDLKPANVMITGPESGNPGQVKILDFGLAKQDVAATDSDQTVTVNLTQPGMIVGTVNYMSPEQAQAKPVDHRSDQFAFGLILYEMATGKKAFERPTAVQIMSAILTEDPPPIEANVPAPLRWIISRCLAKDPADRYESSRDLFRELRSLRDHLNEASGSQVTLAAVQAPAAAPARGRTPWGVIATAFAAGLVLAFAAPLFFRGPQMPDQSSYQFTPFSFEAGGQGDAVWSPDGKSVAFDARTYSRGDVQTYLRSLDSPSAVRLTHLDKGSAPVGWSPDGQRIFLNIQGAEGVNLWSIAKVGGDPQLVMKYLPQTRAVGISPDGKAVAMFHADKDGQWGLWISSPPGSAAKQYLPSPFSTKQFLNNPQIRFSPDGKQILLNVHGSKQREEMWLLPYPANSSKPPHEIPVTVEAFGGTPDFSWMPDSRRIVMSLQASTLASRQLWMADTVSGEKYALTSGTTPRRAPAISPDGSRLLFTESTGSYDLISVDLATAKPTRIFSTDRNEAMPSWAAKQPLLTYVTNRSGPEEIWLHAATGADRPLVSAKDFPPGTTQWFMAPALSPDGDRIIYGRMDTQGAIQLWISSVSGGGAVRLTTDSNIEFPGSWSPDGNWFTYLRLRDGKPNLMKVKTSGQAAPELLRDDFANGGTVPVWSPTGEWIVSGNVLISPDGKDRKSLGAHSSIAYTFSADGKVVYGMRSEPEHLMLITVDIQSGAEKVIGDVGRDYVPGSYVAPSIHFSVSPDGKSIVYSTAEFKTNLWLLDGFAQKRSLWARMFR